MPEAYSKLFASITRSSIWLEDDQTLRVWVTMLALADRFGYVGASERGLAAQARVPVPKTREALAKFLAPDPDSRSPDFDGRRIEAADRGWNLLNYERFRDMRDEEAKREADRKRQRDHREKKRREAQAAKAAAQSAEPPSDFDGSPDETICPADIYEQSERIHDELARLLKGATLEGVQASANRFAAHYIIGPGMGQKRRFWMRELRRWIVKDHGAGKLGKSAPRRARNDEQARADRIARLEAEERKAAE